MSEATIYLMLIGDPGVGKSLLSLHIKEEGKPSEKPGVTLGVDFTIAFRDSDALGLKARVILVDIPGGLNAQPILPSMYRRADGFILMYAVNDRLSFSSLSNRWKDEMKKHARPGLELTVIGNKIDLPAYERQVSQEEGLLFSQQLKASAFYEISALDWSLQDLQKPLDELAVRVLKNEVFNERRLQQEQDALKRQKDAAALQAKGTCCSWFFKLLIPIITSICVSVASMQQHALK